MTDEVTVNLVSTLVYLLPYISPQRQCQLETDD